MKLSKIIFSLLLSLQCFSQSQLQTSASDSIGNISQRELQNLKTQILDLNKKLETSGNSSREVGQLKERVLVLEKLRETENTLEKNIAIENYYSAAVKLLYLTQEINEITAYNNTKAFFDSLDDVANPMRYSDYITWFNDYKSFLEEGKDTDVILGMANDLLKSPALQVAGGFTIGNLSPIILSSIEKFIGSISSSKRELKKKSARMFQLIIFLDNLQKDKMAIRNDYNAIIKDLEAIKKIHLELTDEIYATVPLRKDKMQIHFINETDHAEKVPYLGRVKKEIVVKIDALDKQKVYRQRLSVQSVRIRYGNLRLRPVENVEKYGKMIEKYSSNEFNDLSNLKLTYQAFSEWLGTRSRLEKHINDAVQMYNKEY